jgi:hypothetical protein
MAGSDSLVNTVVTSIGSWLSIDESSSEVFLSRSLLSKLIGAHRSDQLEISSGRVVARPEEDDRRNPTATLQY